MKNNEALSRAFVRFLRTVLPQIPAAITSILEYTKVFNLPVWVVPTLMLVGAVATAVDKFLRDVGVYGQE